MMWFNQGTNPCQCQSPLYIRRNPGSEKREDERAGPSQGAEEEEEELINGTETTQSLSLSELQDIGASSLELEGKEAKQLGSLSREGGIDKAIGKGEPALSLCRKDIPSRKMLYITLGNGPPWRDLQYLRELAVLEVIYGDLDNERSPKDPDKVQRTRPMWGKLVQSAPSSCANSLAILTWKDRDGPTVDEAASNLQEYKESISSSLVSAVEKLSRVFQWFKEDMSYSPPVRTSLSA
ncbi:hypothetical protein QYF61_013440, partial [Mycteria americana]